MSEYHSKLIDYNDEPFDPYKGIDYDDYKAGSASVIPEPRPPYIPKPRTPAGISGEMIASFIREICDCECECDDDAVCRIVHPAVFVHEDEAAVNDIEVRDGAHIHIDNLSQLVAARINRELS